MVNRKLKLISEKVNIFQKKAGHLFLFMIPNVIGNLLGSANDHHDNQEEGKEAQDQLVFMLVRFTVPFPPCK
jgi:hypothetical protein